MGLFTPLARRFRGSRWLLKALYREQHRQTQALEEIARQLRIGNQVNGDLGFVTGAPDGEDEAGVSYTSSRETVELLEIERELYRAKGVMPSGEEVVAEWEARKAN
jgi:hypothetical protein